MKMVKICWNQGELAGMWVWIMNNCPSATPLEQVRAAQDACQPNDRLRNIANSTIAKQAIRLMKVAYKAPVSTSSAIQARQQVIDTIVKMTAQEVARFGHRLEKGTLIEIC